MSTSGDTSKADRWTRLEHLFAEARTLTGQEREALLARELHGDTELEAELRSLLRADEGAGRFVDALREEMLDPELDGLLARAPGEMAGDPWIGRRVLRYLIEDHMGGGGMGVVYRARDMTLGRSVALKFIAPEISRDADVKRRFLREARTASSLDHPNICTIHEVAEDEEGRLFIAMSAYEGETLRDRLARGSFLESEARSIMAQCAAALSAAHDKGIVHRDVKPGNVFLTDAGAVKLLDFGLARTVGAPLTDPAAVKGTIHYMSPEQARGEPADERSDVWSAGVILFEMLSGERPFAALSPLVTVRHILTLELDVRARLPEASDGMVGVVERALSKDPAGRFANGSALLHALGTAG